MDSVRIAVYAAGEKGRAFLAAMLSEDLIEVAVASSYAQPGTMDSSDSEIEKLCSAAGVPFHRGARSLTEVGPEVDLIFVVGWQYLLPPDQRMVVFHDSLLPRYRGFAPTVAALISGDSRIGVTALRPVDQPDAGPILAQHGIDVEYPARIRAVLDSLTGLYIDCARDVVRAFARDALVETPQALADASYSIWRDDEDYYINWADDAARICRTVDALGWPYPGARTRLGDTELTILEAMPGPSLRFEITQPGKLWSIAEGMPTVVCGEGTVLLTDVRDAHGAPFRFERLRVRLH